MIESVHSVGGRLKFVAGCLNIRDSVCHIERDSVVFVLVQNPETGKADNEIGFCFAHFCSGCWGRGCCGGDN